MSTNANVQASKPLKRANRIGILQSIAMLKLPLFLACVAFLFTFSQCFSLPSPFAVVFLTTLWTNGVPLAASFIGILAAFGMRLIWGIAFDGMQLLGCILICLFAIRLKPSTAKKRMLLVAVALLPRIIAACFENDLTVLLLSFISLFLGMAALPAFSICVQTFLDGKETLNTEQKLCLMLIAALCLCGAGRLMLFSINVGYLLGLVVTLLAAFTLGSANAAMIGMILGAALSLSGFDSGAMLQLAFAGMTGGILQKRTPRFFICLVFLLGGALGALLTQPQHFFTILMHIFLACGAFLLLRKTVISHFESLFEQLRPVKGAGMNSYATQMLQKWESAIESITFALPMPPEPANQIDCDRLRHALCRRCTSFDRCWQDRPDETEKLFSYLWELLNEDSDAFESAVTSLSKDDCCLTDRIADTLKAQKNELLDKQGKFLRAGYERDMIVTHLTAMAQAVKRLTCATYGESLNDLKAAMELEEALRAISFPGRLIYARRIDGHLRAAIEAEVIGFNRVSPTRITDMLARLYDVHMDVTLDSRTRIELEEAPQFDLRIGHSAISFHHGSEKDEAIGDSILCERLMGGKQLVMLSDGMGHGFTASVESEKTLELLKLCMDAGYTKEQAITAVNGMMLSATGGDRFATVDLWLIDLWSGVCDISKLGACQSYLIRGQKIKPIQGVALPLGILERITPESTRLKLNDDDILLILSDGVADAFVDEELMNHQLLRSLYQDPQQTADAFLRSALICAGGIPKDDMTVMALYVNRRRFEDMSADADAMYI